MNKKFVDKLTSYLDDECNDFGLTYDYEWDDDNEVCVVTIGLDYDNSKKCYLNFKYTNEDELMIEISEDSYYPTESYTWSVKYFWMKVGAALFHEKLTNMEVAENNYLISFKYTHPNESFITFWGTNCAGYQYDFGLVGIYSRSEILKDKDYYISNTVEPIDKKIVDSLLIEVDYMGETMKVLPNTTEVLDKIGIDRNNFFSIRRVLPDISKINKFLVI